MPDARTTHRYEFRIPGPVSENMADAFPELDAAKTMEIGTQTELYGGIVDEAHLLGLLNRFRIRGLLITETPAPAPEGAVPRPVPARGAAVARSPASGRPPPPPRGRRLPQLEGVRERPGVGAVTRPGSWVPTNARIDRWCL
jgi:hypothetical protein